MFTLQQIESAHSKVKSGSDFPKYIQDLKELGVQSFQTWVNDRHTEYKGKNNFSIQSEGSLSNLDIQKETTAEVFIQNLKIHQQGETDFFTFCKHCAESGIEKWNVDLLEMTCIYFDHNGNQVLVERIPEYK